MKKKRLLSLILAAVMVLGTFASCSSYVPYNYDVSKYITLGEYKGLECDYIDIGVSDADLQAGIHARLKENGYGERKEITTGSVILWDDVTLDMSGSVDGKNDAALSLSDYQLEVGSSTFLDEFEQMLIGQPIGKSVEFDVAFPDDYIKVNYAGKNVHYNVTVKTVSRMVYPELDDQIVTDISESETVDEFMTVLRTELEEESIKKSDEDREKQLWDQVVSNATVVEYPKDAVDYLTQNFRTQFEEAAEKDSLTLKEYLSENNLTVDELNTYIRNRVEKICKDEMVMYAIARQEGLEASNDEIEQLAESYLDTYGYKSTKELFKHHSKELVEQTILYQKVKDFIVTNAVEK